MLGTAIAMSQAGPASAGATDEEAVANKELVREVVDKTKPAAEGSLLNDDAFPRCRVHNTVLDIDDA